MSTTTRGPSISAVRRMIPSGWRYGCEFGEGVAHPLTQVAEGAPAVGGAVAGVGGGGGGGGGGVAHPLTQVAEGAPAVGGAVAGVGGGGAIEVVGPTTVGDTGG